MDLLKRVRELKQMKRHIDEKRRTQFLYVNVH